ncbi:MAG: hypothetical protein JO353_10355 [Phycisphaerae bacterium]|nr:hypothetical protein [Phycisphaerae bacterium]
MRLVNSLAIILPMHFEFLRWWQAGVLFVLLALPIVWLGVRSLHHLGRARQWTAITIRLLVLLLFVLILAGARWVQQNHDAEVIVLRDISLSTKQARDFPGKTLTSSVDDYLRTAANDQHKPPEDRIGVISFGSNPLVDSIPYQKLLLDSNAIRNPGSGTDAASAIQLALATLQSDTMHRLLLIWDGNATTGDLDAALAAAASQHVPIDVMPLRYSVDHEVLIDELAAPAWKRENEPFSLEVILRSTNSVAVGGTLRMFDNSAPMDMDAAVPGVQPTRHITLRPGRNVEYVQVPPLSSSNVIHSFHAVFEPDHLNGEAGEDVAGDTLLENNAADAFTFVRGKGKVLYVDGVPGGRGSILLDALGSEGITVDRIAGADNFPQNLVALQSYDSVILANIARGTEGLSEDQQKMLATYVHDMGGGLVMIGGENTFGAGGWQGSKLEEVLPVTMDIPAQRQVPKGALVLVIDAIEQEEGNYWAEQCALKAVDALSAQDDVAVITWTGHTVFDYALQPKGDGTRVRAAIKSMGPCDFPFFDEMLQAALNGQSGTDGLLNDNARQKHVILISDDDPNPASQATLDAFAKAKIPIASVIDFPHGGVDPNSIMTQISNATGGRVYGPIYSNIAQLPQIFVKEASVIRRSLIDENPDGIEVHTRPNNSELMRGVASTPPIYGLVLTGPKNSPQIEMPLVAGKNNDPVLAHWQTGLGKSAVWTSDAVNKWSAPWLSSGQYDKFWAQAVRWVSRAPQSADFDVATAQDNGVGKIKVEALGQDSAFINFLSIGGQIIGPDLKPRPVHLVQTDPGTYTGTFDATDPGNYVAVLNYSGGEKKSGLILGGVAVNSSPELRDLESNEAVLHAVADRTGGRVLPPFDPSQADLFDHSLYAPTSSSLPIWDWLIPILLGLILLDVASRRIAWDIESIRRARLAMAQRIRLYTTPPKVETRQSLDALARVRTEIKSASTTPAPNAAAKFEAKGVSGDITQIVGGATDQPLPSAPKKIEPKGLTAPLDSMGGLMAAKRRAQQKIKEKEQSTN